MRRHGRTAAALALVALAGVLGACSRGDGRTLRTPTAEQVAAMTTTTTTTTTLPGATTTLVPVDTGPLLLETSFPDGTPVPAELTCDGTGAPPVLRWSGVPPGTPELAVVVSDPDAADYLHWVVTGIDPAIGELAQGAPAGATEARNDAGTIGWTPLCPPPGEQHDYLFSLYALAEPLGLAADLPGDEAVPLIVDGAFASTSVLGTYRRSA